MTLPASLVSGGYLAAGVFAVALGGQALLGQQHASPTTPAEPPGLATILGAVGIAAGGFLGAYGAARGQSRPLEKIAEQVAPQSHDGPPLRMQVDTILFRIDEVTRLLVAKHDELQRGIDRVNTKAEETREKVTGLAARVDAVADRVSSLERRT